MLTRNSYKNQKGKLLSATRISNWVKNDPIIDYLDIINENKFKVNSDLEITRKRSRSRTEDFDVDNETNSQEKKLKSSFDYIVESGNLFEVEIIKQIEKMMEEKKESKKIIKIDESNINLNYSKTINIILSNKYSIIFGSVLMNEKNNTWGKPDLIVKGEWICKYIEADIPNINPNKWYIIDIKSSTINLISGGDEMSSKILYNTYKSQIYIYTDALNESLKKYKKDNNVTYGFILGKKYKYVANKNTYIKKSFQYLGIVDFTKNINGQTFYNLTTDAVKWNNELRKNWKEYKLNPINKDELFPNMKNQYDKNWHKIKKEIAVANKEITLLWNCGIANRKLAWEHGIKRYDNPKLNAKILGFEGKSKETIIDSMLQMVGSDKNYILDKHNDYMEWQSKSNFEFFVDFETYNTDIIWDENNDWENSFTSSQKIYMIGISYIQGDNLVHKSFLIKYQNYFNLKNQFDVNENTNNTIFGDIKFNDCVGCSDELDLIKKFSEFLISFKPPDLELDFFKKNIRLCHWSNAEPTMFNKKINEYNLDNTKYDFNWYDLLKIFKYDMYPIIIKECFGFGLKEIIKKLNKYGLINLSWSDLDDGLLSSFIARDIYMGINMGINSKQNIEMFNIIEYNYIDCKALYLLLKWMR
jgi:hypothetical protein